MTVPVERSRSRRPVTWLTLIGVLLLPAVIGGILVGALYDPTDRLDNITAAVVNDDKAVELDGQLVPLGRQLTGGLVKGADDQPSNIDWVISNDEDAAAGLKDGTYTAVVTIPDNFSAAALSTRPGETPERATIGVETAPNARVVDGAITAQLASTASAVFGSELSSQYLTNVFLGFTTLGQQLGSAAGGAHQLADGAGQAADGASSLQDGLGQLSDGASQLASGAQQLAAGAGPLADGASQVAGGATALAGGTREAAAGVGDLAGGANGIAEGNQQLANEINGIADQIPPEFAQVATDLSEAAPQVNDALVAAAAALQKAADECTGTPSQCEALRQAAADANAALPQATATVTKIGQLAGDAAELPAGIRTIAAANQQLADGARGLAGGATKAADGLNVIAGGIDGVADGANQVASGVRQFGTGAAGLSSGAAQVASGASGAEEGAGQLADGVEQVATGTSSLADGLDTAVAQLPTYSDAQAQNLADVVADPVSATGVSDSLFGIAAVPLLAMAVLWFGGVASFVAFQAVSARALTSRRASGLVALRGFAPAAIIGAAQGLLVAGVVQVASRYDWGDWALFALVCIAAGVAFAAVNQALVAVFGGAGRWIAAIVGALAVGANIVSTVPPLLAGVASLLPTSPAYASMLGALASSGGVGAGIVGLAVWAVLALIVTTLVVVRRRTASLRTAAHPA
ncbi:MULTISPECIES: YhgE/Pip domain-containing protein [Microbacterium]|jgi:putative membrane protein|uniref:YhgE/Pip domain-containing protein n=1 Tax=Microbacterium TaxID=33882 RepID=UPI001D16FD82|nr:YhgE/Pip domain-containing protein [Microbacterium testaceum]MCC4250073.1 YhgE/Pip domain-containing protein [Microbacterium testaceum]